eukprot:TRINITY_DN18864_c0_g1_i1.p1 TRINITY_DN18864_c0_g1~~TRINITY_DN18864_c0_g1_i1.p1  ORF type:complete len:155 (-),score=20.98 TRINITY_DN18864_c0_g1_i1:117-581(-)
MLPRIAMFIALSALSVFGQDNFYNSTNGYFISNFGYESSLTYLPALDVCQASWTYLTTGVALQCESTDKCFLYMSAENTFLNLSATYGPSTASNYTCFTTDQKYTGINLTQDVVHQLVNGLTAPDAEEFEGAAAVVCDVLNGATGLSKNTKNMA